MSGTILRYFAGGNTAKGFYNLYESNLTNLERVFVLSGKSQREKSVILERLLQKWEITELPIEVIYRSNDPDAVEGLIFRSLGVAMIDGDDPRNIGHEKAGSQWETIDLEQTSRSIQLDEREVMELTKNTTNHYEQAYAAYEQALHIHDDWEEIYINRMDFAKADQVTNRLMAALFAGRNRSSRHPQILRRFLGAATPKGAVDFVDNITAGLANRYFLKGRAGTGKSTLLKKIVSEAEQRGYDLEIYHCGFDPNSLDMVLVRELGWAVFDSTKPHEYFPSRPGDEILDMYELTVAPGTDELFAAEISNIESQYREKMDSGKHHLVKVKEYMDELEDLYWKGTNQGQLATIVHEFDQLLTKLMGEK